MDSRDYKDTQIPEVKDNKYLESIYGLQKELLNHYIGIEGLPQYPIDVNSKKNQVILKDFTGRVIEELGEGYESMVEVNRLGTTNQYFMTKPNEVLVNNEDWRMTRAHIQNINEELADALHFMMELMVYANIEAEDILTYLNKLGFKAEDLDRVMVYGSNLIRNNESRGYRISSADTKDICTHVGWEASDSLLDDYSIQLWDITYSLSISRNCLKNKPWKQSGELTDENTYQKLLCESFVKLMGFYYRVGYTAKTLYETYYLKNLINQFRIKSKY